MRASVKGLLGTLIGNLFWRRGILFVLDRLCFLLTEAIFSFNFWKAASIVSLGEAKNGFIFGPNFGFKFGAKTCLFWSLCGR